MDIDRSNYVEHFGPTTGDKVRLGDTDLFIEVEADHTVYGDEVKFGGGKVIRDGMGQSSLASWKGGSPDLVITNALILDWTGIFKADIAIRNGKISAIGKSGNPGIMDGVSPGMEISASTEVLAGEGRIITAGGIDAHIHFISPNQIPEAFYSGVTTLIGGGTGPATGTNATTRVSIESTDKDGKNWFTIGVSPNIIEASFNALIDSLDYKLYKEKAPANN